MSKKTIIALISIAVVIIAAIAVAINFLYKEREVIEVTDFQASHPLITCVPSDAAIVFCSLQPAVLGVLRQTACGPLP